MRLEKRDQPAGGDDLLHRAGKRWNLADDTARGDRDAPAGQIDLERVVFREPAEVALDRERIVYSTNIGDLGRRHLFSVGFDGGPATAVTGGRVMIPRLGSRSAQGDLGLLEQTPVVPLAGSQSHPSAPTSRPDGSHR